MKQIQTKQLVVAAALTVVLTTVGACSSEEPANEVSQDRVPSTTSEAPTTAAPVATTAPAGESVAPTTPPTSIATETESIMPHVVCMNLQAAQDLIQTTGVFFSDSFDASGQGRSQMMDSNWVVVSQDPPAGSPITEGSANLGAVKIGEPNDC